MPFAGTRVSRDGGQPGRGGAQGRSPLETPDAVKTVRVHLDGATRSSKLESGARLLRRGRAGAERHRGRRGRHRSAGARPASRAAPTIVEPGAGVRTEDGQGGRRGARSPRPRRPTVRSSAPTGSPRRARASSTSRRGPPRAQQANPIVGMQLENDSGDGHAVRLRPDDEPLRRLRAVHVPPEPVQARRTPRTRSA